MKSDLKNILCDNMKDKTIDIIKNNIYYLRSPFKGKISQIKINNGQNINKGDVVATIEYGEDFLITIKSEYDGTIQNISKRNGNYVEKWESIMTIQLEGIDTRVSFVDDVSDQFLKPQREDYRILYDFQQTILPHFIYNQRDAFLLCIAEEKDIIFELLKSLYEMRNKNIPFKSSDFIKDVDIINNEIILMEVNCPKIEGVLLADRIFIAAHRNYPKIQYFTMEESFGGKIMLSSIIMRNGKLSRSNYGPVENNREIQKRRVLDIFLNR